MRKNIFILKVLCAGHDYCEVIKIALLVATFHGVIIEYLECLFDGFNSI